jgi:hypothetical protein
MNPEVPGSYDEWDAWLEEEEQYQTDCEAVAKHWYRQRYTKLYGEVDEAYQRLLARWRAEDTEVGKEITE